MTNRDSVFKSANLPSLPDIAVRLIEISSDPETGIRDVVAVVRNDSGIVTRIIKAVNSPYFGLNAEVSSVEGAIPLMGLSASISLSLSFSLVQEETTDSLRKHWSRSLLTAVTSEYIAREHKLTSPGTYFLAGLLSDLGVLAMLNTIHDEYSPIFSQAIDLSTTLAEREREVLGFDHVDIGTDLASQWSLPELLVNAIRFHHETVEAIDMEKNGLSYDIIRTVRFATCVTDYLTCTDKDRMRKEMRECGAHFFDFDDGQLDEILLEVRERTDEAAAVMSIDASDLPRPTELLANANAQLVDIALRNQMAMSQLTEKNNQLKEQTVRDSLTKVHSRLAFDDRYHRTVQACLDNGGTAGVIFCDVDKFKVLNDTYGHAFGDEVLRRVAGALETSVRDTDFVARYGGEEFVVVALDCEESTLAGIAERLRSNVEALPIEFEGNRIPVTISVGGCVATTRSLTGRVAESIETTIANAMLTRADEAMYHCKRSGRNRIETCRLSDPRSTDWSDAADKDSLQSTAG